MITHLSKLHLHFLGPPQVCLDEQTLIFPTRKTLALLAYLVLETGAQPREHLLTLLYPEASSERSHANLRNTLSRLQIVLRSASRQAHPPFLCITHNSIAFNREAGVELDIEMVERAFSLVHAHQVEQLLPQEVSGLMEAAVNCWRGDFLSGFSLRDAPEFDDWVDIQREIWRRRLSLILDRLSAIQFNAGEFASAADTAARSIALDGLNEAAYRLKMNAHSAAGERGQALQTYEACRTVLATELSVEPDRNTQVLAERIRSQHTTPHPFHSSDTPLVFLESLFLNRSRELQSLIACYQRVSAGQPHFVVLQGEAGIGKTRLAHEFLSWTDAQGAHILQGSGLESKVALPFYPLLEGIRTWLERTEIPRDWLKEAWFPMFLRLLPELRTSFPPSPLPFEEISFQETNQFFEPFTYFGLKLAREMPLVIFIDDLQWVDQATLDLLQYSLHRWKKSKSFSEKMTFPSDVSSDPSSARILLLVSLRSEALQRRVASHQPKKTAHVLHWLSRMEREITPSHLALGAMEQHDLSQKLQPIFLTHSTIFLEWLFAQTAGQPFYLMEILKDLLERRLLQPVRQPTHQWMFEINPAFDSFEATSIPPVVCAFIRSRLNQISPNAFNLLTAAAILESDSTFDRLCTVSHLTGDEGLAALDELLAHHLLKEDLQPQSAAKYALPDKIIHDVVIDEAGDARRRWFQLRSLDS